MRPAGTRHLIISLGLMTAVLLAAVPAHAEIRCSIAPTLAITGVLGMPSALTTMTGPAADKLIPSATNTQCNYTGGTGTVLLTVVEFASAAAAQEAFGEPMVAARFQEVDDPEGKAVGLSPVTGLGERAFGVITVRTAGYAALKGSRVLLIGANGPGLEPLQLAPKVKSLTATVLGKL